MFSGPSNVFWTNIYGPFRGFTLSTGLPRGFSLLPVKWRSDAVEEIEEVFFFVDFRLTRRGRFFWEKGGFPLREEGSPLSPSGC